MRRRRFLESLPLAAGALNAQHPGFAPVDKEAPPLRAATRYAVLDGAIGIDNGTYYNNRPLYCAHIAAAALGGDRPLVRLIHDHEVCGVFALAFLRGGAGKWLDRCESVRMRYRCGHITWQISDPMFPGLALTMEAVPCEDRAGFAARVRVSGAKEGDRLLWVFGGAHAERNVMWAFDPVLLPQDDGWRESLSTVLKRAFEASKCAANEVRAEGNSLRVTGPGAQFATTITCSHGTVRAGDAAAFADPARLATSAPAQAPIGLGIIPLSAGQPPLEWNALHGDGAAPAFEARLDELRQLAHRVEVKTPEARLDAAVTAALHAVDAIHYPPVFRHGAMAWNVRLPGWRTLYGGTVFGWHERVLAQARFYLSTQIKEPLYTSAEPEPKTRLCEQSARSRLNGLGRLPRDAGHYDFQSQLFDQLIHAWRWTGSKELEQLLRDTLPLHAIWMRECFDPDDDGLYESYINTWPTDTVWYNGGGSVEESAYAFTVHRALADLLSGAEAEAHRRRCEKLRDALFRVLWVKDKGHFAAYIEQGGHRRVHTDAWLYSQFLPIDAGITTAEQAMQALQYTERALENVEPPFGGRRVWSSNWVPSKWSARELYHGDNYALALAYFQCGLADEGWRILQGNLLDSAFARVVPGSQSNAGAATDFGDILHPFCRAVVEGLFGYVPDRPSRSVLLRPALPSSWPEASIRTPDFSLNCRRAGNVETYELTLTEPAAVEFRVRASAAGTRSASINGTPVRWVAEQGAGFTTVIIPAVRGPRFTLAIEFERRLPAASPRPLATRPSIPKQAVAAAPAGARWRTLDLDAVHNGDIRTIFQQQYLSPRPATVSVRLGVDGYSPWTFAPWKLDPPAIDLSRVAALTGATGELVTPQGARFRVPREGRNVAFTSLWDNWPARVEVPVNARAEAAWLLVAGSTNPMQTRIANAAVHFHYAGGATDTLELVPPLNFWSLCPLGGRDYLYPRDAFCLPPEPPPQVQLGANCRAMVLRHDLLRGEQLTSITFETLSQEVVVGLLAASLMNPA